MNRLSNFSLLTLIKLTICFTIVYFGLGTDECTGQTTTQKGYWILFDYKSDELTDSAKTFIDEFISLKEKHIDQHSEYDLVIIARSCPWEEHENTFLGLRRAHVVKRYITNTYEEYNSNNIWIQERTLSDITSEDKLSEVQETLEDNTYNDRLKVEECSNHNYGILLTRAKLQ